MITGDGICTRFSLLGDLSNDSRSIEHRTLTKKDAQIACLICQSWYLGSDCGSVSAEPARWGEIGAGGSHKFVRIIGRLGRVPIDDLENAFAAQPQSGYAEPLSTYAMPREPRQIVAKAYP